MPQSNYIYATPGSRRNGSMPNEVIKPSPTTLLHNFMSYTSYQQQTFGGVQLQETNMYNSNSPPAKGRKGFGGSPTQRLGVTRRPTSPSILSEEQRKYLHQPSYVKFGGNNNVVYHQFRNLKLEVESPLLSKESLNNFHQAKVKLFPNTGRELEV